MKSAVSECPIEEAMVTLSGRWPTLLLYYLQNGTKRFGELQKDNPTISHRMLARELRKLEAAGIVARTAHEGYPSRVDYCLTDAGRRLLPLIDALGDWWTATMDERRTLPQQRGGSKRALDMAASHTTIAWPPSSSGSGAVARDLP